VAGDLRRPVYPTGSDQGACHGTVGVLPLHGGQVGRDDLTQQRMHQPIAGVTVVDDEVPDNEVLQRLDGRVRPDLRTALPMNCRRRARNFVVPPDAQRDIARITHLWRDCRARFGAGGAFLFGEFSIADAMYAPVALRFRSYGVALGDSEQRYADAVRELPAVREWSAAAEAEGLPLPKYDAIA